MEIACRITELDREPEIRPVQIERRAAEDALETSVPIDAYSIGCTHQSIQAKRCGRRCVMRRGHF